MIPKVYRKRWGICRGKVVVGGGWSGLNRRICVEFGRFEVGEVLVLGGVSGLRAPEVDGEMKFVVLLSDDSLHFWRPD